MSIQVCRDTSDAVALYLPQRLYLKSYSKLNISVQLPTHKVHGKSISNWELMEKLRKMIQPDNFSMLKVSKLSSEVIRFEAELESRGKLERVLARLEGRIIQLNDYPDPLKVRVSEVKTDYPSRHAWDSFFRDATDMDEMKPGERPDTVHIRNLPIRWFVHHRERDDDAPPSESIFKKCFEKYGDIRQVDVPASDPFRLQMKEAMRGITIPPSEAGLYFEGYVQFNEYVGFVRCMDALRGKKLVRKNDDLAEWCAINVDFDKTKHMTDAAVKRRAIVRERLFSRRKAVEEEERLEKERIAKREAKERAKLEQSEKEKLAKMKEREERRKKKQLAKLMERDDVDLAKNITDEQKKLLKAQKRLQAVRLIEELFKRIELRPDLQRNKHSRAEAGERAARARIVDSVRRQHERTYEEQRERLKSALDGRIIIRSALETKKPKRESSVSSISSVELPKRVKTEKLTTPEREMEYNRAAGMYPMANPYSFGYPYAAVPPPGYPFQTMYYGGRGYMPNPTYAAYEPRYHERRGRGRGRGRGRAPRMPYFDGPDASQLYYQYFKKLTENESRNEHDDRSRRRSYSRSRSRSRSRRRSYTRSRSRSRRRSYTRSRSRSRRRSRSRSRSKSRRKSRSRSKRTRSKSRDKSRARTPSPKAKEKSKTPRRSKSWSLLKDAVRKSWSKSPKK